MKESGFFPNDGLVKEDLGEGVSRCIMAHNSRIMMVHVFFEKNAEGKYHSHVHTQSTYILEGKFEFNIDSEKKVLGAGDSIVFASSAPHGCVCLEKGSVIDVFTPSREDFLKK